MDKENDTADGRCVQGSFWSVRLAEMLRNKQLHFLLKITWF